MSLNKRNERIFLAVGILVIIAIVAFTFLKNETPIDSSLCVASKAVLYVQTGCSACVAQEKILGDNLENFTVIDCMVSPWECSDITSTPTWKISETNYVGIKSWDELKRLTGC